MTDEERSARLSRREFARRATVGGLGAAGLSVLADGGAVASATSRGPSQLSLFDGGGPQPPAEDAESSVQNLVDMASREERSACVIPDRLMPYRSQDVHFPKGMRLARQSTPGRFFDVTAYGAAGDGKTDDTPAVRAAIGAAAESDQTAPVYFPEGEYAVQSIAIPLGVHVVGTGVNRTVLKGVGTEPVIQGAAGWVRQYFKHFQVIHDPTVDGGGGALIDQRYGARRCEFEDLKLVGVDGRTTHGIRLRGEHPDRGMVGLDDSRSQGVFYNILRNVHCRTEGGYLRSEPTTVAFYLEGTTTPGARANLNLLERCHVAGWRVGFRLDEGHDNIFINCKQEDPGRSESFPDYHLEIRSLGMDSETHDNLVIAQSFDASNPDQRVHLHNEQIENHPTAVTFIGGRLFNPSRDITFTTGSDTEETVRYQAFGVIGGSRISDRDYRRPAGRRSARMGGAFDDGVASFDGGEAQDCGRFIAAAREYAQTVEAVSKSGGASISIRDAPESQFRLVKTKDGLNYSRIWDVDTNGIINFQGEMRDSSKNPARREPDDWVEVKIDGVPHYVPAYRR